MKVGAIIGAQVAPGDRIDYIDKHNGELKSQVALRAVHITNLETAIPCEYADIPAYRVTRHRRFTQMRTASAGLPGLGTRR